MNISDDAFIIAFKRFQELVALNSNGHPFETFNDGLAHTWESYKPRLRNRALALLDASSWKSKNPGDGTILRNTLAAIEISDSDGGNNLVLWQNRWGHANREHRALIEAQSDASLMKNIEQQLFNLFCTDINEGKIFERLAELMHQKYPLLGYLYFLKDIDRFFPVRPTVFDKTFVDLDLELKTARNCSWENYSQFCDAILLVQTKLSDVVHVPNVTPIDAHSFCWMLQKLEQPELDAEGRVKRVGRDAGRKLNARDTSLMDLRYSIVNTARQANGQSVQRTIKVKELRMTTEELDFHLKGLMDTQQNRCALTGLPFQFKGNHSDTNMLPSPDRIDSNGHYEVGNIQLVCRFVNFWKQDTDNEEFKRLLMIVRGQDAE